MQLPECYPSEYLEYIDKELVALRNAAINILRFSYNPLI